MVLRLNDKIPLDWETVKNAGGKQLNMILLMQLKPYLRKKTTMALPLFSRAQSWTWFVKGILFLPRFS